MINYCLLLGATLQIDAFNSGQLKITTENSLFLVKISYNFNCVVIYLNSKWYLNKLSLKICYLFWIFFYFHPPPQQFKILVIFKLYSQFEFEIFPKE